VVNQSTKQRLKEIKNQPYEQGRILCAEQNTCTLYDPWSRGEFTGSPLNGWSVQTRANVRCENLGDDHRCCGCPSECNKHNWVCTRDDLSGKRKKVGIVVLG